jgi:nucleotide sugar dehydrogenase
VAVVGSGYVGTVVAAGLAHVGHQVVAVERDRAKLDGLRSGSAMIYEPGLEELMAGAMAAGSLSFTADMAEAMAGADVMFICVGTPASEAGDPDMTAMVGVAESIAQHLDRPLVVVTKSTVPVGSGRWLASVLEEASVDPARTRSLVGVVSNPEFLREGTAVFDFLSPDRVVIGSDDPAALEAVAAVYEPIVSGTFPPTAVAGLSRAGGRRVPLVRTDLVTAEMAKYASNAFLATKISFINEIAKLCQLIGADVTEVANTMGLDPRIGSEFLGAGLGWGGSCFGKDVAALIMTAEEYGLNPRILHAATSVNVEQRRLVVDQLLHELKTLRGARVAILGLAFKPGTDDLRDSPAVDLAQRLVERGAFVSAHDPVVDALPDLPAVRMARDPYAAAAGADAVVIATHWEEFISIDLPRLRQATRGDVFMDARNGFSPRAVAGAGFRYFGIGRSDRVGPAAGIGRSAPGPAPAQSGSAR